MDEDVRNEFQALRLEMRAGFAETQAEIAEMRAGFAELRTGHAETRTGLDGLNRKLDLVIDAIADFRSEYGGHTHE